MDSEFIPRGPGKLGCPQKKKKAQAGAKEEQAAGTQYLAHNRHKSYLLDE